MRILLTVLMVLIGYYVNTINHKVLKEKNIAINDTENYKNRKEEKSFLEETKTIVKKIVKSAKNVSFFDDSDSIVKPKKEKLPAETIEFRIRTILEEEGIKPYVIDLIVAQSKHESGNYRNTLTDYNNIFARHYFRADTFAISAGAPGEGHRKFAKYPSVEYATLSQLWYFKRKGYSMNWTSTYQFAAECKRKGYYEAPLSVYVAALNKYMP